MKPKTFMLIAGEPSGDLLGAELVKALRAELAREPALPNADFQPLHTGLAPRFFGAGGPCMGEAGVDLAFDMTGHAIVGLVEVLKKYLKFRRFLHKLLEQAIECQPDVVVCVDFSGFNRRFGHALKRYVRAHQGPFANWNPALVQYVSPQVWASRESRARKMARDFDLLLSIFPFEKEWYATHASSLRVEYVGHPIIDRYAPSRTAVPAVPAGVSPANINTGETPVPLPLVVLLPGSRPGELARHLPVMQNAAPLIASKCPVQFEMCLPNQELATRAAQFRWPAETTIRVGGLADSLSRATVAIASTGTVTMECAYFGVLTVALYKTSWSTYEIGKRIIQVNFLAMPNLLAGEAIYPEFIQHAATPENVARATLNFVDNPLFREAVRARLAKVIGMLGPPGASGRAAHAILQLLSRSAAGPTAAAAPKARSASLVR